MTLPDYVETLEGKVRLKIPNPAKYLRKDGVYEPSWAPIFYNPKQVLNRDISVIALSISCEGVEPPIRVIDPLSGTGVRALRYVKEVEGVEVAYANDINEESYRIIRENVKLNKLMNQVRVFRTDANALMYMMKSLGKTFFFVDIDPYGSPAPFIDAGLWVVRNSGLLGVTATDTAPLSGTKWRAGSRRYDTHIRRFDIPHYLGLRVLLGYIARRAACRDRYIDPLITFVDGHYYRIIMRVRRGASEADMMLEKNIGYLQYCSKCGNREVSNDGCKRKCPICGSIMTPLGPMWIGKLVNKDFLRAMKARLNGQFTYLQTRDRIEKLIDQLLIEGDAVLTYNIATAAKYLHVNMPKTADIIDCLSGLGYYAVKSYYCGHCVSTNASWEAFLECVKCRAS